jgi:hypothetical protein
MGLTVQTFGCFGLVKNHASYGESLAGDKNNLLITFPNNTNVPD